MSGFKLELRPREELEKAHGIDAGGRVQRFIDSEVLKLSDPYVPMDSGNLRLSGERGTEVGSGEVAYNAPYAQEQYRHGRSPGRSEHGPLRGREWFERMKADHGKEILRSAKEYTKGGRT